jgi:hypothetical protein
MPATVLAGGEPGGGIIVRGAHVEGAFGQGEANRILEPGLKVGPGNLQLKLPESGLPNTISSVFNHD